ncbi:2-thiouracil desulfurase family protein, partial [Rhizobium ruizarguesonis]
DYRMKQRLRPVIETWRAEGRLVTICPEMSAGMTVPRPPEEIAEEASGEDVLAGKARVVELTGADVTEELLQAEENAVALARQAGCHY